MKNSSLTEDKAEQTPTGGVLVGKRQGQTIIHNKGTLSGYLVGKTHAEGGIKAVNKSTGQPLEMQGGEVVITAPAVSDNTKNEFNGKMMTNREILSTINEKGGGVSFAKGGDIPKNIKRTGASYKYGGKTMTDHEIYKKITGGHLAEGMTLSKIAKKHKISLKELQKQVDLGMRAESEHTSSKREQMKIVKDHLFENSKYYTLLKRAGLENGGSILLAPNGNKSNLTPKQYKLVRTPAFKKWFGDWENDPENSSKVVDENGEPMVVYHFSDIEFNVFEIKGLSNGFFFTKNIEDEEFSQKGWLKYEGLTYEQAKEKGYDLKYEKGKPYFLNIKQFFTEKNVKKQFWSTPYFENSVIEFSKRNKKNDGVEFLREIDGKQIIVAFEPEQIKLADGSNTTFDANNPDVRYKKGGAVHRGSLVRDSKNGNSPSRDLNNYNDVLDLDADGMVGAETGLYVNGGELEENLPKIGSKVEARWDNSNRWVTGIFKGETKNGFEVYDFTIERPDHIEYYAEITEDSDNRNSKIFKSKNFKDRNYKNYHFTNKMADGGAVGSDWDITFTSGNNKGEKLSEQEIETIDVYDDFVYGLTFKNGGFFDAKTSETVGLLSITNNPVKLAVILEKDVDGYDYKSITSNQKIKRRLNSLAEKSNRVIVINDSKLRIDRQFPYLLVSESDAKNYELASEFYEKLETPRNEFKKQLTKKLQDDYQNKTLDELRDIKKIKYSKMPIDSPKSEDEKLLDKLIAEKFSLMNQEIKEKRKSFESEGSTEGKGKLYEFFTPQIVADKMLALAQHYGFKGGNVLEPATGSGRLIKNLKNTNITAFEISKDNFEILKREFPNAELYNFNFEKAFLKEPRFNTLINRKGTETWLKNAPFDLVLANPPYGKFSGLYSSYFNFKGQVEHFFILQTLYLLKKGGLGVYLIPSSFLRNGVAYNEIKKQIFEIAEFVDAYRLPSNIFEKTQIGTDILILRKK